MGNAIRESINIREVGIEQATLISEFVSRIAHVDIGPTLGPGGLPKLLASFATAETRSRFDEGYVHWIAFEGETDPVGVAVLMPPSHLFHLFVRSDRQRRGIGRALLEVVMTRIERDAGIRSATVNASLNALNAYRRFGFINRAEAVDRDGVRYQPMVFPAP